MKPWYLAANPSQRSRSDEIGPSNGLNIGNKNEVEKNNISVAAFRGSFYLPEKEIIKCHRNFFMNSSD